MRSIKLVAYSVISVSYCTVWKASSPYWVMLYFWWGRRGNLKLITLGSIRIKVHVTLQNCGPEMATDRVQQIAVYQSDTVGLLPQAWKVSSKPHLKWSKTHQQDYSRWTSSTQLLPAEVGRYCHHQGRHPQVIHIECYLGKTSWSVWSMWHASQPADTCTAAGS